VIASYDELRGMAEAGQSEIIRNIASELLALRAEVLQWRKVRDVMAKQAKIGGRHTLSTFEADKLRQSYTMRFGSLDNLAPCDPECLCRRCLI